MRRTTIVTAAAAAIVVLVGAYAFSLMRLGADMLVVQATSASSAPVRAVAWWRLRHLADCPYADFAPTTPFGFAVSAWDQTGDRAVFERLLQAVAAWGCDINQRGARGLTALHSAILFNNLDAVQSLTRLGADPAIETAIDGLGNRKAIALNAAAFADYLDQVSGEDRSAVAAFLARRVPANGAMQQRTEKPDVTTN